MHFGHWGFDRHPAGSTVGPRLLGDHDLILFTAGSLLWILDGQEHRAMAPCLLLARPGQEFTMVFDGTGESRNVYVHFSADSLPSWLPGAWPAVRPLPPGDIVPPLMHHLAWLLEGRRQSWEHLARGAVLQILGAVLLEAGATAGSREARLDLVLERLVAALLAAWRRGLRRVGVEELAAAAGLSAAQLHRICLRDLGCSPGTAERLIRLEHAATRVAGTREPLAAIAADTGFADAFHFSKAFRAAYGHPPKEFRRHIQAGGAWIPAGPPGIRALCRRLWEDGLGS